MGQINFIKKYFSDGYDYPKDYTFNPLPLDTLYCYINTAYLNGFINDVEIVKAFVIGRYLKWDEELPEHIEYQYVNVRVNDKWTNIPVKTKQDIYNELIKEDAVFHVNLDNDFKDDVLILGKVYNSDKTEFHWIFFWFDRDSSDSCIGKFITEDTDEEVIQLFTEYCNHYERSPFGSKEIPLHYFKGWISG